MSKTERKTPEQRVEEQRNRILKAAERCFIERGFHAASMAELSAAAQMSPGLIYRYFESKSAIILAIIQRHLQEACADIASLDTGCDLISRICELFEQWHRGEQRVMNPVLFLETVAESTRDPQISAALDASERTRNEHFAAWLKQYARERDWEMTDIEVRSRALAMKCFIEGLTVRAARQPDLDRATLRASLEAFLPGLLQRRGE